MLVKEIAETIENFAPPVYQEGYDICGLQVGDMDEEVRGVLICLDVTEAILEEAMERGCNMIVSHHPLLFSGLKRISGRTYVERIVQKAIKNDVSIYSCHTSLDNMRQGVNAKIAERLGLIHTEILSVKTNTLSKLYTYVPFSSLVEVRDALFAAGAGEVGLYKECSFHTTGTGTFRPGADANPTIGKAGGLRESVEEGKIEVLLPKDKERSVLNALFKSHPYEEVAYELVALQNANQDIGAGMVGMLPKEMDERDFLLFLKKQMKTDCIRHTALRGKKIERIAVCGGTGSFLLGDAIKAKADVFITGDFKYHQFFDAEGKIIIADIGHYESEQFTPEIFEALLKKKFPNFAILLSNLSTNPVNYFC